MWSISSQLVTMRKKSRKSVKSWPGVLIVMSHWTKPGMIYLKYFCCKRKVKWSESHSVMSDSLRPHGLYSPWNSPGQNTGVGSISLLQGIFPTQGSNPGLLHCRWILYQLSYQESPYKASVPQRKLSAKEKAIYRMRENICKPYSWYGVNISNI